MAFLQSRRLMALTREWVRRHGEPPPITADAALLARILRETAGAQR